VRVVGYARTTWEEQVKGGFPGIEEQERELREFAERTGLALDKVHTDSGLSPTQGTCAGLINILDSMEDVWEAVIVTAACRLRSVSAVSFDPIQELKDNGKRVLVADEVTAKALAPIIKKLKSKQAAKAKAHKTDQAARRREIAERLLKGREAGAKAGKHQSGPAPFGYRRDYSKRNSEGVMLVPETEEAEVVKLIFREYLRLRSMKRLIKLLDDQGLRTRRGKRWSRAGVSWILKNDTYVGRVHFGDIHVKGRHESIVAPILFNKVQKLIRANNKRNRKGKPAEKSAGGDAEAAAPDKPAATKQPAEAEAEQTPPKPAAKAKRKRRPEHASV